LMSPCSLHHFIMFWFFHNCHFLSFDACNIHITALICTFMFMNMFKNFWKQIESMEQHQHLNVSELNKSNFFLFSSLLCFLFSCWWFCLVVFDELSHSHTCCYCCWFDYVVYSHIIICFFLSITSSSVLSSTFLCHHLLPHYFKLEPSWLKREVAWVSYSTLISHICIHVVIVVTVVKYCIIISFF
jgi:hypothetical protein